MQVILKVKRFNLIDVTCLGVVLVSFFLFDNFFSIFFFSDFYLLGATRDEKAEGKLEKKPHDDNRFCDIFSNLLKREYQLRVSNKSLKTTGRPCRKAN